MGAKFSHASWAFLLAVLLMCTACPTPIPVIPVQSILFENDGSGFIRFYTNDTARLGYTYFEPDIAGPAAPMTTLEVQLKKISGASNYGYGAIFCWQDINNFYAAIITIDGYFKVYRRVGGTFTTIIDWTLNADIIKGYNALNTVKVIYTGGINFTISFNNGFVWNFSDAFFTSGQYGFLAAISTSESFPGTPVDIRYKMLQPAVVP